MSRIRIQSTGLSSHLIRRVSHKVNCIAHYAEAGQDSEKRQSISSPNFPQRVARGNPHSPGADAYTRKESAIDGIKSTLFLHYNSVHTHTRRMIDGTLSHDWWQRLDNGRFVARRASDIPCKPMHLEHADESLSDEEDIKLSALWEPVQQAEKQPAVSAGEVLGEGEHSNAPIATSNNELCELVQPNELVRCEPAAQLVADASVAASRRRDRLDHDSLREPSCHSEESDCDHCPGFGIRSPDSDYTNEDFLDNEDLDTEDMEVVQKQTAEMTSTRSNRKRIASERRRELTDSKCRPGNWRTPPWELGEGGKILDVSARVRSDSSCLSPKLLRPPSFIIHAEHRIEQFCKLSTAADITAIEAPPICDATGHWFDRGGAVDGKPNPNDSKAKDISSTLERSFLARMCGCFRVQRKETTCNEEVAPPA